VAGLGPIARTAAADYLVVYPPRILAVSTVPRAVFQVAFYSLIGFAMAGERGRWFAFVGATVHIMTIATVIKGPDVLVDEKVEGTMYRLRLGRYPLAAVVAVRWWVFIVEALASAAIGIVGVGLALGFEARLGDLLQVSPLYVLVALSTAALGLAAASLSVGRRADVMATNLVAYLLLLAGGVVAPLAALGPLRAVSEALPMTHGLLAIRAALDGRPFAGLAVKEAAIGLAWAVIAVLVLHLQSRRARRKGFDDFF
jgi:ABC-2 type transport system permease protein